MGWGATGGVGAPRGVGCCRCRRTGRRSGPLPGTSGGRGGWSWTRGAARRLASAQGKHSHRRQGVQRQTFLSGGGWAWHSAQLGAAWSRSGCPATEEVDAGAARAASCFHFWSPFSRNLVQTEQVARPARCLPCRPPPLWMARAAARGSLRGETCGAGGGHGGWRSGDGHLGREGLGVPRGSGGRREAGHSGQALGGLRERWRRRRQGTGPATVPIWTGRSDAALPADVGEAPGQGPGVMGGPRMRVGPFFCEITNPTRDGGANPPKAWPRASAGGVSGKKVRHSLAVASTRAAWSGTLPTGRTLSPR